MVGSNEIIKVKLGHSIQTDLSDYLFVITIKLCAFVPVCNNYKSVQLFLVPLIVLLQINLVHVLPVC